MNHGLTPQQSRIQNRKHVDSGKRTWSIAGEPKLAGVDAVVWTTTIADVRLDTPEHYCADIRRWAQSILADTKHLV